MYYASHPGEILKDEVLEPLGLSVTEAAENLGITRKTLSGIINGKVSISVNIAIRLEKATNIRAELWLNLQNRYDLWQKEQEKKKLKVKPFRGIEPLKKMTAGG